MITQLAESTCVTSRSGISKHFLSSANPRGIIADHQDDSNKKARQAFIFLGDLDANVQKYIQALHTTSAPCSTQIIQAGAEGILTASYRTLLMENGGYIHRFITWISPLVTSQDGVHVCDEERQYSEESATFRG